MNRTVGVLCVASCWLPVVSGQAGAQQNQGQPEVVQLTGGFADHVVPGVGGRIDWTNGYILAQGQGLAQRGAFDRQAQLLAQKAAREAALRNALALAEGIRIDADGKVGQIKDGLVRIEGTLRGHQEDRVEWFGEEDPPRARVTVRVPLWGVTSVSSLVSQIHRTRRQQAGGVRRGLVMDQVEVADYAVVIDARGTDLSPCLFPVIKDGAGGVLYDVRTPSGGLAQRAPLARYVETELSFEELRAAVEGGKPLRFMLAGYQPTSGPAVDSAGQGDPDEQPTTQPTVKKRRRAKRRMAVKVTQAAGQAKTEVVLTQEDVDRIRRSPEGASALRRAQVVIVVNSAAAGTEGRLELDVDSALCSRACARRMTLMVQGSHPPLVRESFLARGFLAPVWAGRWGFSHIGGEIGISPQRPQLLDSALCLDARPTIHRE
ncbi:MAG: hypothetical protein ACE5GE_10620 [Phycisphaerae bacterium]